MSSFLTRRESCFGQPPIPLISRSAYDSCADFSAPPIVTTSSHLIVFAGTRGGKPHYRMQPFPSWWGVPGIELEFGDNKLYPKPESMRALEKAGLVRLERDFAEFD